MPSKILWANRYLGDIGNKGLVTLDGTDLPVQMKFAENFMSHKFKGNGVKYEIGVNIQTGEIACDLARLSLFESRKLTCSLPYPAPRGYCVGARPRQRW